MGADESLPGPLDQPREFVLPITGIPSSEVRVGRKMEID
jgi:hypothetical protein